MKLDNIRREYCFSEINSFLDPNPHNLFKKWMEDALNSTSIEPTAMSLITNGLDGFPQSRIVLLKHFNEKGFTFFTNYQSQKGSSMLLDPKVSLHFFWPELERQIRISGISEKTTKEISEEYFNSRPLGSRIAVLASEQSRNIPSREYLDEKFSETAQKYIDNEPKKPEYWGGYVVTPLKFEFWQGRKNRLHDRIVYTKNEQYWELTRLAP